ncbi:MAG TPA: S9 family peptidase [Sphingomicrobium sp.]|nr:S9 family peptidase [Sphingomicrobium sp.]
MRFVQLLGVVAMCSAAAVSAQSPASTRFEAKDLFYLQTASDPQVRPGGRMVAYVRSSGDVMNDRMNRGIWLIDLATAEETPLATTPGQYSSPRWSPDGKRIAYVSNSEGEKPQLFVRWMDTATVAKVAVLPEVPREVTWSPDGRKIAFVMFTPGEAPRIGKAPAKPEGAKWAEPLRYVNQMTYRTDSGGVLRPGQSDIYIVSASGGAPIKLSRDSGDDPDRLSFTPDGRFIVYGANRKPNWMHDPVESEIWKLPVSGGPAVALTDRDGPDGEPAVSPDGRHIAYVGYDDQHQNYQNAQLYVMNADGSGRRSLTAGIDQSMSQPEWSEDGRSIYVSYADKAYNKVARVGLDGRVTTLVSDGAGGSLDRPYSGGEYSVESGVIAYTTADAGRASEIAVARGGSAKRLTDLNADLFAAKRLGEVRPLRVTSSRDGQDIDAWLVLPPDYQPGKRYPTILEIHGGPASSYGPFFATDMQLYAAAGYLVVYPNARLSTSYGEKFAQNPRGGDPFPDYAHFISTVDAAIAAGFADPDNLFVTGGSYGGYAAAAIIGKTDRFRAAALQKPVINWISKILNTDISAYQYEYTYGKQPWNNPEVLWRNSPLSLVGNVKTPTLIVVGENDYRTPVSESEQYYGALQLRGIPSGLIIVPGASHGGLTARPSQSAAKAAAIIAWFDRYKKGATDSAN